MEGERSPCPPLSTLLLRNGVNLSRNIPNDVDAESINFDIGCPQKLEQLSEQWREISVKRRNMRNIHNK